MTFTLDSFLDILGSLVQIAVKINGAVVRHFLLKSLQAWRLRKIPRIVSAIIRQSDYTLKNHRGELYDPAQRTKV